MLAFIMAMKTEEDREKAAEIYRLYRGTMLYTAKSILHETHLAEDAVSEAFIKIINNLEKINVIDCYQTRGFIVIIVRNTSIDLCAGKTAVRPYPLKTIKSIRIRRNRSLMMLPPEKPATGSPAV